jgi:hypothetical protein
VYENLSIEEIAALAIEKRKAFADMLPTVDPTVTEQVEALAALADEIEAIEAAHAAKVTAAEEATAKFESLKTRFSETPPEEVTPPVEPVEEEKEEEAPPVEQPPAETPPAQAGTIRKVAAATERPNVPDTQTTPFSLVAAANVEGFSTGQKLDSLTDVALAAISRAKAFGVPNGDGKSVKLEHFGTALLELDFPTELTVDRRSSPEDMSDVMDHAIDESRLPGGSLTAAGGWCSPSETDYSLEDDSTTEGLLSLPTVNVKRGGMRFAISPTFAAFYANPGFIQTEAQAIAGTVKPCVEVPCPSFTDVRLDAEGICIKVPILTEAAYPEVVRQFVSGTLTAHQHWINANVIGRVVTAAGAARVFTGLGSVYSDSLEAIGLVINQTKQKYRLGLNASVEVVVPFWVKDVFKNDLRRQSGRTGPVTDAEMAGHFASINANVQYVYDWQLLDETAEVYPATFQAVVYPAGTFVKGVSNIIKLNTVYDAASLATNVYTGLFAEQGLLVAKKKFHADLITVPICAAGRTGASNLTCGA